MASNVKPNERARLGGLPPARVSPLQVAAQRATDFVAGSWGFASAVLLLTAWVAAGWFTAGGWDYGDRFITGVSFVLLFLLQRSQSKDSRAVQLKLNELLAALDRASTKLINIEDETEEEVEKLHDQFQQLQHHDAGVHSIEDCSD
ncbi:MAG: low affinity iron permease family protein [Pirellulales bacterium]|nr:low affinity iron permease family protein [Pirellulales bacterium]